MRSGDCGARIPSARSVTRAGRPQMTPRNVGPARVSPLESGTRTARPARALFDETPPMEGGVGSRGDRGSRSSRSRSRLAGTRTSALRLPAAQAAVPQQVVLWTPTCRRGRSAVSHPRTFRRALSRPTDDLQRTGCSCRSLSTRGTTGCGCSETRDRAKFGCRRAEKQVWGDLSRTLARVSSS